MKQEDFKTERDIWVNKALRPAHPSRASRPEDMDIPGFKLHPLKDNRAEFWSVTVRTNWRIIFRFEDGDVTDVDLIDYH